MSEHHLIADVVPEPDGLSTGVSRLTTATLFAAALLSFLLPFATVSCGDPVTFTGLELATGTVEDPTHSPTELAFAAEIESYGTVLALVALGAVVVGLVLAAFSMRGSGAAALVALLALMLLPWSAAYGLADFAVYEGYAFALAAAAALVARRRVEAVRRRRREGARILPAVLAGVLLAIPIGVTAALCIAATHSYAGY
ncbi:MAG: hypothetical protein M5U27_10880 [Gaiella sp.]|nr:hypothetical protein [Gaiella sp.]